MFMMLVGAVVTVLGAIILFRAAIEGSWERIKVLGLLVAAALIARGAGWLDGYVSPLPWGLGTFGSAMCGVVGLVLWILVAVGLLKTAFESLESLKTSNGY